MSLFELTDENNTGNNFIQSRIRYLQNFSYSNEVDAVQPEIYVDLDITDISDSGGNNIQINSVFNYNQPSNTKFFIDLLSTKETTITVNGYIYNKSSVERHNIEDNLKKILSNNETLGVVDIILPDKFILSNLLNLTYKIDNDYKKLNTSKFSLVFIKATKLPLEYKTITKLPLDDIKTSLLEDIIGTLNKFSELEGNVFNNINSYLGSVNDIMGSLSGISNNILQIEDETNNIESILKSPPSDLNYMYKSIANSVGNIYAKIANEEYLDARWAGQDYDKKQVGVGNLSITAEESQQALDYEKIVASDYMIEVTQETEDLSTTDINGQQYLEISKLYSAIAMFNYQVANISRLSSLTEEQRVKLLENLSVQFDVIKNSTQLSPSSLGNLLDTYSQTIALLQNKSIRQLQTVTINGWNTTFNVARQYNMPEDYFILINNIKGIFVTGDVKVYA